MVSVVISVMSLLLDMLVVFFDVSSMIVSIVVICDVERGMLYVCVMNNVVSVRQIVVLFRLNEQLVGSMRLMMFLLQLSVFSLMIRCGRIGFVDEVVRMMSNFLCRQCNSCYSVKLCSCVSGVSMFVMNSMQVMQKIIISFVSELIELMLKWFIVKVIVLNVLSGVSCMIIVSM